LRSKSLLSLSTIRQHFNSGFSSVLSLIEDLKQQFESLTLANQSPNHLQHLEQTIAHQKYEIRRLTETIDYKTEEIFKLHQSRLQFHNDLQLRLTEVRRINRHLRTRIRELEYLLAAGDASAPKLDSHNSNLPPSLDPPWKKPPRTRSLRTRSGRPVGGVPGHQGFTLRQVSEPDLVIIQRVNVCQHVSVKRHSGYERRLADLPWQGVAGKVALSIGRFFCTNDLCAGKIFAERLQLFRYPANSCQFTHKLSLIFLRSRYCAVKFSPVISSITVTICGANE
jgi:hypothetical protein